MKRLYIKKSWRSKSTSAASGNSDDTSVTEDTSNNESGLSSTQTDVTLLPTIPPAGSSLPTSPTLHTLPTPSSLPIIPSAHEDIESIGDNGITHAQSTIQPETSQSEVAPKEAQAPPIQRNIPLFPTLGDLPGLLVSASPGTFQRSPYRVRRRYLENKRKAEEEQRLHEEEVEEVQEVEEVVEEVEAETYTLESTRFKIPMITESGNVIYVDEFDFDEDTSDEDLFQATKPEAAGGGGGGAAVPGAAAAEGDAGSLDSQASANLANDDKIIKAYFRGIFMTLAALGLFVALNIGGAFFLFNNLQRAGHPYTCWTPNCEKMAQWILKAMNPSEKPCENFYYFACGNYLNTHPVSDEKENPNEYHLYWNGIPIDFMENERTGKMLKKVNTFPDNQILPFYQACIDKKRREKVGVYPFINLLSQIRLLYIQSGAFFNVISKFNVARAMGRIYRKTNRLFFFDFDSVKDNYILFKVSKPPDEVIHTPPEVYAEAMRKTWKLFGKDMYVSDDEIETIVYLVMRFEAELGIIQSKESATYIFGYPIDFDKLIPPPEKFHENYIKMRGRFEWEDLVATMMSYTPQNYDEYHVNFNLWSTFYSKQDRYYAIYMKDKLRNTPSYIIFRYFQWQLMKTFAFDMNDELKDIMATIFRASGVSLIDRCFRSIFSDLHVLAAHRYKTMIPDVASVARNISAVKEKVFNTFSERVSDMNLPLAMKASLLATAKTVKITLHDPNSELDKHLETYYKGLNCSKDHFFNVVQAKTIKARNGLLYAREEPPFHIWSTGEYSLTDWKETAIAEQFATIRYLHVPFGAIQEPFLGNDLPMFNYAGFGHYMVSIALMKFAIDDLFQVYEANLRIWEPKDEVAVFKGFQHAFLGLTECVIRSQSELKLRDHPDLSIHPEVYGTRVRMIAETLSLELTSLVVEELTLAKEAMKGEVTPYRGPKDEMLHANQIIGERFPKFQVLPGLEKYTPAQLVYLGIARHHCQTLSRGRAESRMKHGPLPNELVIQGSFRNSKDFAKVWGCSKKSFMNPKERCTLFYGKEEGKYKDEEMALVDRTEVEHRHDDDYFVKFYDDENEQKDKDKDKEKEIEIE